MYTHRDPALAPATAAYWEGLGLGERFEYVRFVSSRPLVSRFRLLRKDLWRSGLAQEGGHEFDDESAWAFIAKHL